MFQVPECADISRLLRTLPAGSVRLRIRRKPILKEDVYIFGVPECADISRLGDSYSTGWLSQIQGVPRRRIRVKPVS